jgi:hypothetical protein
MGGDHQQQPLCLRSLVQLTFAPLHRRELGAMCKASASLLPEIQERIVTRRRIGGCYANPFRNGGTLMDQNFNLDAAKAAHLAYCSLIVSSHKQGVLPISAVANELGNQIDADIKRHRAPHESSGAALLRHPNPGRGVFLFSASITASCGSRRSAVKRTLNCETKLLERLRVESFRLWPLMSGGSRP